MVAEQQVAVSTLVDEGWHDISAAVACVGSPLMLPHMTVSSTIVVMPTKVGSNSTSVATPPCGDHVCTSFQTGLIPLGASASLPRYTALVAELSLTEAPMDMSA